MGNTETRCSPCCQNKDDQEVKLGMNPALSEETVSIPFDMVPQDQKAPLQYKFPPPLTATSPLNLTAHPGAPLSTFLCPTASALPKVFETHVPPDVRSNLGGVILMTIGWSLSDLKGFCDSLDCPVYVVETFGIIGWNVATKKNTEGEEQFRGSEYGAPGNPEAKPGITVIACSSGFDASPIISCEGRAPTLNQGALAHCIFARFECQPEAEKFFASDEHAVGAGGFVKKVFQRVNGNFVDRSMVIMTLMESPDVMVNVCHSYGVYDTDGVKCNSQKEGRLVADSLPRGFRPLFCGQFQCFMRGFNAYGKPDVEAEAMAELYGPDLPAFGGSFFGEIGNSTRNNPIGWNSTDKASEVTWHHSFCTVVLLYAVRTKENWNRPPKSGFKFQDEELMARDERFGVAQNQLFEKVQGNQNKSPNAYIEHLRVVQFPSVGVPDAEGISFWKVPGGMKPERCYAKSSAQRTCDVFLSHALKADPKGPTDMLRVATKYAVHKCVDIFIAAHNITIRWVAEGRIKKEKQQEALMGMTFWCDTACVDHSDTRLKMYILKSHLEDFIQYSEYFVALVSTVYFTRLWCLYEFACACKRRKDLDSILVMNPCLAFFEIERVRIIDTIVNISVASSNCFDPEDRHLIVDKINTEYKSVNAFERWVRFSACALAARASIFWAVEHYSRWLAMWADCARRCGFADLADAISAIDTDALRVKAFQEHPDPPACTNIAKRQAYIETTIAKKWYKDVLEPMIKREHTKAVLETPAV